MILTPSYRLVVLVLLVLGAWLVVTPHTAHANWGEQTAADLAALELAKDDQAVMASILGDYSLDTPLTPNSPPLPAPDQEALERPLSSPPLGPAAAHDDDDHLAPAAEEIALSNPQRLYRDSPGASHLGQQPDPRQVIAGSAPLYQ